MTEAREFIDRLIVNTPYDPPQRHWEQTDDKRFALIEKRRPAGYFITDTRNNTNRFVPLELAQSIRQRMEEWRAADYQGATTVTKSLLAHWHNREEREYPFYFCQLEAIETLVWWVEAPVSFKQGITIPGDGGPWERLCNKMATGTGKTTVMSMIVAWQVLNALTYSDRKEFSRAIFIVTPGLTVKERLQVLYPSHPDNYYDAFEVVPAAYRDRLNQAVILIENWHSLMPPKPPERSVVKKGRQSDEAFTRDVLGVLADYKNLVVINDEAHHAYRIPAELKTKRISGLSKEEQEEATRWIEGLDRIHKTRRILRCFDLSATPFAPTGKKTTEEALFPWIVSDFGLNDAIETGLVKTPRIVVRDDALPVKWKGTDYRPRLYHLYMDKEVKDDLNSKAEPDQTLPPLVQIAYTLLGADWLETLKAWEANGHAIPPAMLTVCNRIETARRIEHFFLKNDCLIHELNDNGRVLRVDSTLLDKAEVGEESTKKDEAYEGRLREIVEHSGLDSRREAECLGLKKEELLRAIVDNVGKPKTPGQRVQNVISVAMLSEGWDAKNVTHILGLRAFTSQLLCEQVVGRGLRRTAYDKDEEGRFKPEYVNVIGVPFTFLPIEGSGPPPPPPTQRTPVESLPERGEYEIRWPNVLRIEQVLNPTLTVEWSNVQPLELQPHMTPTAVEMAPTLQGIQDVTKVTPIDLQELVRNFRFQHLVFHASRKAYERLRSKAWEGEKHVLIFQIIRIVEQFLNSDRIVIPSLFHQEELRKRVLLAMQIDRIVEHICRFIRQSNTQRLEPVFDRDYPIGSTANMRTWYTSKPCHPTQKSQISQAVFDSSWESQALFDLDRSEFVEAYVKNDHLGFSVLYLFNGAMRKYFPDYLIRLKNGKTLVLEIKGKPNDESRAKRAALAEWVEAVNAKGGFGEWCEDIVDQASLIHDVLKKHGESPHA
ncbi:BPTD_3080 family restriction endonuclease [Methylomagnum sp.]